MKSMTLLLKRFFFALICFVLNNLEFVLFAYSLFVKQIL
ncbi:putative membrane protein [Chlamydia muridarum]|nr:putative membrane protein [Chlamydia muridarum]KDU81225.1 putative membrane protein [Chlamydia muridarum]KDU82248.1 putative membrane protein [Chlamydia muridarum]KDU83178.1 putative membrane protein [Chlamydia muridarum]KDU83996.1 putative membrane protein [Chlamydia muridarum]